MNKLLFIILILLLGCTQFTPASPESQERARTKAKYIGQTEESSIDVYLDYLWAKRTCGTSYIHECMFDQLGGDCSDIQKKQEYQLKIEKRFIEEPKSVWEIRLKQAIENECSCQN